MSRLANQLSQAVIEEMMMLTEYINAAHETIVQALVDYEGGKVMWD